MSDEKQIKANVDSSSWVWGAVFLFFLLASDQCGTGLHWRYDGQPHSFVWTGDPAKAKK